MRPKTIIRLIIHLLVCLMPQSFVLANGLNYGDPPDANHPWSVHDRNRPQPPRVEPGATVGAPPSDAVVLFDGTEASFLENWRHFKPEEKRKGDWIVKDGVMQCTPGAGYIGTKKEFGDCQLHIEWAAPLEMRGSGQGRGNSGVFLMGVEVQVLDNYENPTYADGTAGAVYGVMPPAANPLRSPTEWQSYDIIFRRPIAKDGVIVDEGAMTVLVNGVVVQDNTPLEGGGGWRRRSKSRIFPDKGPLTLQDHGNPVRFRNIWIRPLRPRPVQGGFDGRLSPEATVAKRLEIAAEVRADAANKEGVEKIVRLLESLHYAPNEEAWDEADLYIQDYMDELSGATESQIRDRRWDITKIFLSLKYLQKHDLGPADYPATPQLEAIMTEQDWKWKL